MSVIRGTRFWRDVGTFSADDVINHSLMKASDALENEKFVADYGCDLGSVTKGLGVRRINYVRMGIVVAVWMLVTLGMATHASLSDRHTNVIDLASSTSRLPFAIRFSVDHEDIEAFQVSVFNLSGVPVFQSESTTKPSLRWNMLGPDDQRVPNGIYLYAVEAQLNNGQQVHNPIKKIAVLH